MMTSSTPAPNEDSLSQMTASTRGSLLLKTMMMSSSTPSPNEDSLSQMTASTRGSFFSATNSSTPTTTTTSSTSSPDDQSYLTPYEGTTSKLISPFQVNPGARAAFWKYYSYYEDDTTRVCCNKCGTPIKVANGTTGLSRHLKHRHPHVLEKINSTDQDRKKKKAPHAGLQPSIMGFCAPSITEEQLQEQIKGAACEWLLEDMLPTSMAESEPFRKFLKKVIATTGGNKGISPLHRLSRRGCDYWIEQKEITMRRKLVTQTEGQVLCLTIDHWTSRGKQSYTGMTCHWIDDDFVGHAVELGCFLNEGGHDADSVTKDLYEKLFKDCGFQDRTIFSVTSDTTGNMNKFGMKLSEDKGVHHIYCTDHVIQLTAHLGYQDKRYKDDDTEQLGADENGWLQLEDPASFQIDNFDTLTKARELVNFFSRSTNATNRLKFVQANDPACQELYGDNYTPLKVVTDVVTRWWSTYSMIDRLLWLKVPISIMIVSNQCPVLSNDDWKYLVEIRDVLHPFMKAQKMLEGEKYVTSSWVLETIQSLRRGLESATTALPSNKYDKVAHNLAKVLLKDLNCRWGESSTYNGIVKRGRMNRQVGVHPALVMASFLDPRFKHLQHLPLHEKLKVREDIYLEMVAVLTDSKYGGVDMTAGAGYSSNDDDDEDTDKYNVEELIARYGNGNVRVQVNQDDPQDDPERLAMTELEVYKGLPASPAFEVRSRGRVKIFDPLQWWKNKEGQFPILAKLARVYLAVPATSAPSERVFSKANHIISKTRCRLDPAKAGRMIWLSSMIKNSR
jgi:hypothetical protein